MGKDRESVDRCVEIESILWIVQLDSISGPVTALGITSLPREYNYPRKIETERGKSGHCSPKFKSGAPSCDVEHPEKDPEGFPRSLTPLLNINH